MEECVERRNLSGVASAYVLHHLLARAQDFRGEKGRVTGMSEMNVGAKSIFELGTKYKTTTLFIQDIPWRICK